MADETPRTEWQRAGAVGWRSETHGTIAVTGGDTYQPTFEEHQEMIDMMVKDGHLVRDSDGLISFNKENSIVASVVAELRQDDVKCEECWTCEGKATNQVWRDALNEYEHTCDSCHRNEYPEEQS